MVVHRLLSEPRTRLFLSTPFGYSDREVMARLAVNIVTVRRLLETRTSSPPPGG